MKASQPGQPFSGRTIWTRKLQTPLREFLRTETGGASVLLSAAIAALVWVNVDASSYDALWGTTLSIDVGGAGVALDLRHWVNSGLITFFFVLGLEARREFDGSFLQRGFSSPITLGILFGYVAGKPLGILGASWLVARVSHERLRPPVGWVSVAGGRRPCGQARATVAAS